MRKTILLFISFVLLELGLFSQEQTIQITPSVQSAVVYLDGAELYHSKQISVNAGRTQISFNGVSSKVISKSIQVTASGDVSILSVTDKLNYLDLTENSSGSKQIRDSIKQLNDLVTQLSNDRNAYETEKEMMLKNQSIGGQDKGVSMAELKLAADFYRNRIKEINVETYKLDKKTASHLEQINKLNKQLYEINGNPKGPSAEITVLIASAVKQTVTIDLKYLVSDAGWAPSYDLITEDVNKPITLKYRAKVYNNTDVDWKNIKIKLSTGDPMKNASKPILEDWYLNFNTLNNYSNYDGKAKGKVSSLAEQNLLNTVKKSESYQQYNNAEDSEINVRGGRAAGETYFIDGVKVSKKPVEQKVTLEEIEILDQSAEFDIKTEYSIPSDAKPYIIDVTTYNLPANYKYFSIPKVDKSAFMLAQITGWEELELVSGNANVYLGGTYVGQSYINTKSTNDTLDLSVGRDNKIMVSRAQLKDFNNEKIIGNNKKTTYGYEIILKNNRKGTIVIDVEDQIPVSQSSEITVETIEISKGELNPLTGKIKWRLSIEPGEVKKLNLSYSIKYPRNKSIQLKKYKTISAPSF